MKKNKNHQVEKPVEPAKSKSEYVPTDLDWFFLELAEQWLEEDVQKKREAKKQAQVKN